MTNSFFRKVKKSRYYLNLSSEGMLYENVLLPTTLGHRFIKTDAMFYYSSK